MPKTSVKEINQRSSCRRRELRYSTKVKCDDFGLWLIQIGIFVLYVKLVVRTTYAQAQTLRGYTFMWSSRCGEGWSGKKLWKLDIFHDYHKCMVPYKTQRQPSRGVFRKRFSENVQQIYRRTPMPKCDFKRVAKQLYWNHTSASVFSCNFAACFQNTFS